MVAVSRPATLLLEKGCDTVGVECDVTDELQVETPVGRVAEQRGRVDVLVNCAGRQFISPIESFPPGQFEAMIQLMLTAPFYSIKYVFAIMKAQNFGRVINIASINGLIGLAGKAANDSAKHGVIGLTKIAALEGASHGITANAQCPGYVDTPLVQNQLADLARNRRVSLERVLHEVIYPLIPRRRLLHPQETANYVAFLAGDAAKGVTGQAIVIDGGYTAQ